MKTNFYANFNYSNTNLTALEKVNELKVHYSSIAFANDEEKAGAFVELSKQIDIINQDEYFNAIAQHSTLNSFIPTITISDPVAKNSTKRKRAVENAIQYIAIELSNTDGTISCVVKNKNLLIKDIYNAHVDLLAFKHANNKPTMDDKKQALTKILSNEQIDAILAFKQAAYKHLNIADNDKEITRNIVPAILEKFSGTPSKAKAERDTKTLASYFGIEISYKRCHGLALYNACVKTIKGAQTLQPIINILQEFVVLSRYAKNDIELPEVRDNEKAFSLWEESKKDENVIIF